MRTKGKQKIQEKRIYENLWLCEIYGSLTLINITENLAKQEEHRSSESCLLSMQGMPGKPNASAGTISRQNGIHSIGKQQENKQYKHEVKYFNTSKIFTGFWLTVNPPKSLSMLQYSLKKSSNPLPVVTQ